jgi:hypothetical protein
MEAKELNQVIQIVNGNFSPFDASDMLNDLITSRISYHHVQMLRMWEGNHHFDSNDSRIKMEEMIKEKTEAIALIAKAKNEGLCVEITGNIEVKLRSGL